MVVMHVLLKTNKKTFNLTRNFFEKNVNFISNIHHGYSLILKNNLNEYIKIFYIDVNVLFVYSGFTDRYASVVSVPMNNAVFLDKNSTHNIQLKSISLENFERLYG